MASSWQTIAGGLDTQILSAEKLFKLFKFVWKCKQITYKVFKSVCSYLRVNVAKIIQLSFKMRGRGVLLSVKILI